MCENRIETISVATQKEKVMNYELEISPQKGIYIKVGHTLMIYGGRTLEKFRRSVRQDLIRDLQDHDVDAEDISDIILTIEQELQQ